MAENVSGKSVSISALFWQRHTFDRCPTSRNIIFVQLIILRSAYLCYIDHDHITLNTPKTMIINASYCDWYVLYSLFDQLENSGDPPYFKNSQSLSYWNCVYFLMVRNTYVYTDVYSNLLGNHPNRVLSFG